MSTLGVPQHLEDFLFSYFSYTLFLNNRTSCIFQQKKNYGNYNKRKTNVRLVSSCLMDDSFSCSGSSSNSPGEMIEIFYKCINEKNLKEMSTYISEDCLIEDTLFSEKFKGKKVKMSYIKHICIHVLIHRTCMSMKPTCRQL